MLSNLALQPRADETKKLGILNWRKTRKSRKKGSKPDVRGRTKKGEHNGRVESTRMFLGKMPRCLWHENNKIKKKDAKKGRGRIWYLYHPVT